MMKKFTLLLMCVITAVTPALAAQLTLEEWNQQVTLSPTVESVTTELPGTFRFRPKKYDECEVVRTSVTASFTIDTPDEVCEGISSIDGITSSTNIMFNRTFTTPGNYTLTIPAGTLSVKNWKTNEEIGTNPELIIEYTVKAPKPPVKNPLDNPVMIPASGSQLRYIKDNIWVTFEGAAPGWNLACFSSKCIKVECTEGVNKGNTYGLSYETPLNWKIEPDGSRNHNQLGLMFEQTISTPGTYVFTFYPGSFHVWVDKEQLDNPLFSATYYVVPAGDDEVTLSVAKAVDPSNDAPVNNFSKLHIEFPQCNPAEQGLLEGYEAASNISIRNKATNAVYYSTGFSILDDLKTIEINFDGNKITDNGEYILIIPAGIVRLKGTSDPREYNPDLQFNYNLVFSVLDGVEETIAEPMEAPVYDMMGRTVLEKANTEDLNRLPAGIYIYNGAKYVVK